MRGVQTRHDPLFVSRTLFSSPSFTTNTLTHIWSPYVDRANSTVQRIRPTAVLVVEDASFARQLSRFMVDRCGIDIIATVAVTKDVLDRVRLANPDFILVDLSPVGLKGLESIVALRSATTESHLIVLSSLDPEYGELAIRSGADAYIEKARVSEDLPEILERA